ncbi:hypothetical protein CICLE_v10029733mg [Citrus x clementina]|uniref:Uncharacterized protein n=1 Tax=Citrus clementina TaxID=85681 RepID=V4S6M3_CITCL|nr:hypothetical protein CICLE_v10029733mg [Citrus x clementina]
MSQVHEIYSYPIFEIIFPLHVEICFRTVFETLHMRISIFWTLALDAILMLYPWYGICEWKEIASEILDKNFGRFA